MSAGAGVTVILVNYNSGDALLTCLSALRQQTSPHNVFVIDNASTDGSARSAHDAFPEHDYLPLRRNTGFARAVNLAVERVQSGIIVLLNPDTEPEPRFIENIVGPFSESPAIGAVSGTLVFRSNPGIIASAGIDFHGNGVAIDHRLGEQHDPSMPVEPVFGASGGAAAYRRDAFIDAGCFPEVFFMYLEDADLAWRMRLSGWQAVWAPGAVAIHDYSASAGEGSAFKRRLLARNRIWMMARCLPDEYWQRYGSPTALFDVAALGYGALADRPAALGRLEALARIGPRLCERRAIQRSRTAGWDELNAMLSPPISVRQLRRQRQLTASLAAERESESPIVHNQ